MGGAEEAWGGRRHGERRLVWVVLFWVVLCLGAWWGELRMLREEGQAKQAKSCRESGAQERERRSEKTSSVSCEGKRRQRMKMECFLEVAQCFCLPR